MSTFEQLSKQSLPLPEKEFFEYFYHLNTPANTLWKPLKDKYRYFKQQSYNTPKHSSQISFLKKFTQICAYIPFVQQIKTDKIQISLIQDLIEVIYDEYEDFFSKGGWRTVKNKSLCTHLQEHVLLKIHKAYHSTKFQKGLGNLFLGFFYTLNYYKTCNYQIRLFNEFLLSNELQSLFIFILLRKKSRRISKDLTIRNEYITNFVHVLKGEKSSPSFISYSSENEEVGTVKLLLIYPQIMEYIKSSEVVLHQIMLYSLMKCVGLAIDNLQSQERTSIDWNQFLSLYFKEVVQGQKNYQQQLIQRVVKANLKIVDSLFKIEESNVTFVSDENQICPRQRFLEQSFGWLIGMMESIIYGTKDCNQRWRDIYLKLQILYEEGLTLGNKLVEQLLLSQDYYKIYSKYCEKENIQE